jgi:hypothetical protein
MSSYGGDGVHWIKDGEQQDVVDPLGFLPEKRKEKETFSFNDLIK